MTGRALLIRGSAFDLPLVDASVHGVVTSPPYWQLRDYKTAHPKEIGREPNWQLYLDNLLAVAEEVMRVLVPTGSAFFELGDKYVTGDGPEWLGIRRKSLLLLPERFRIACIDRGWIARSVVVLNHTNGLPESVTDRPRRSHVDMVQITKAPRYFAAVDEIREPHVYPNDTGRYRGLRNAHSPDAHDKGNTPHLNPLGKLPGSVWSLASEPLRTPAYMQPRHPGDLRPRWAMTDPDAWTWLRHGLAPDRSVLPRDDSRGELRVAPAHYAAFPSELVRRVVLGWTPHGICVACGEGRWPVVDREIEYHRGQGRVGFKRDAARPNGEGGGMFNKQEFRYQATILGYACPCCPSTLHPGTGEPSGPDTRYGDHLAAGNGYPNDGAGWERTSSGHSGLGDRPRVGPWREYHLDRWTPPPTRPAHVLDPFAGTYTTPMTAAALGRIGIGVELSADYVRLGGWRIEQSGHQAKALGRTHLERQASLL